jgi:hypothetical protein
LSLEFFNSLYIEYGIWRVKRIILWIIFKTPEC